MAVICVPLSGKLAAERGAVALIDEADAELVLRNRWQAHQPDKTLETLYAMACTKRDGKWRTTYMHRVILEAGSGVYVDHKDGNGLNNTRDNIRLCSQSQNNANCRDVRAGSGYRGVYRSKGARKYFAAIQHEGRVQSLGRFEDPVDAARAYDAAARKIYGEFARPNFSET